MKKIKLLLILTYIFINISIVNAQDIYTGIFKTTTDNTDYHHFTRSHAIGAAVYVNQVSTGPILRLSSGIFDANQNVKFTVENNGYVGIGTINPMVKLQVNGMTEIDGSNVTAILGNEFNYWTYFGGEKGGRIRGSNEGYIVIDGNPNGTGNNDVLINSGTTSDVIIASAGGSVGIGTTTPLGKLDILAATDEVALRLSMPTSEDAAAYDIKWAHSNADVVHRIQYANAYYDFMNVNRATRNVSFNSGNVAIGTTTIPSGYKLAVNGKIIATEIKVETGWADFVFEPTYNLMPLKELDTYIQENKHLPEIPTTAEVQENGISVGEMNAKLLQKIEELTLYTIQQQDLINNQQNLIETLKQGFEAQNSEIQELKKLIY